MGSFGFFIFLVIYVFPPPVGRPFLIGGVKGCFLFRLFFFDFGTDADGLYG